MNIQGGVGNDVSVKKVSNKKCSWEPSWDLMSRGAGIMDYKISGRGGGTELVATSPIVFGSQDIPTL